MFLIKCLNSPNKDSAKSDDENESTAFYNEVFNDDKDLNFQHFIMTGLFNVALEHEKDTFGYSHVNNTIYRQLKKNSHGNQQPYRCVERAES